MVNNNVAFFDISNDVTKNYYDHQNVPVDGRIFTPTALYRFPNAPGEKSHELIFPLKCTNDDVTRFQNDWSRLVCPFL